MKHLLLAAGLFLAPLQDDAQIKELIRKLDDSDFQTRDEAFHALVKAGPKAVALLKEAAEKSTSAEVKTRAADAIKAIDLAVKAASVYREPARINAAFADTPLPRALEDVAKQAGVRLEGLAHAPEAPLTLKLENATLLEALDRICAAQEQLTYAHASEGVVSLVKEKHAQPPAVYFGPFRVQIGELTITRKSDFKATTTTASFTLASEHEKHLKPLAKVRFEISKAIDDQGTELQVARVGDAEAAALGGGGAVVIMGLGGMRPPDSDRRFEAKGFSPAATGFRLLQGTATFLFPLQYTDVKFKAPAANDREETGDFAFKVLQTRQRYIEFEVTRTKGTEAVGQDEIDRRLDADSVVLVDADGKEHKAESLQPSGLDSIVIGPGGVERKLKYRAMFATAGVRNAKELRFRFIDKTLEKQAPFEFKDVRVP